MRTVRAGALIGAALIAAALGVNAINCASATTITLDIRANQDICDVIAETGIVVTPAGKETNTSDYAIQQTQKGCQNGDGRIGTLVITPHTSDSLDRNAKIGVRVVSGLNGKTATDCDDPKGVVGEDCIIARREISFVEGANVPLTIILSGKCVHYQCPDGQNCDPTRPSDDLCVADEAPPSGTSSSSSSSGGPEPDSSKPGDDAGDAGQTVEELCERGKKNKGRTYLNGTCNIDCALVPGDCKNANPCPDGQKCLITCNADKACEGARCSGPDCTIDCSGLTGLNHCTNIACDAGSCNVKCLSDPSSCSGVLMVGATNTMNCNLSVDAQAPATCNNVSCVPGPDRPPVKTICNRSCEGANNEACGPISICDAGDCSKFEDAGP